MCYWLVERVKKQTRLFADTFYDALKVLKTEVEPAVLSRLVAAHSKIDMEEIKQAYSKKYPVSLEDEIFVSLLTLFKIKLVKILIFVIIIKGKNNRKL